MAIPGSGGGGGGGGVPIAPEEERRTVDELEAAAASTRKEGDLYYIISSKWWRAWQSYVGSDRFNMNPSLPETEGLECTPSRPGQIDNTELISNEMEEDGNELVIDRGLMEGPDYILVPEEVWKKLIEWYKGGPDLPRRLIFNRGFREDTWMVEVHLITLQLIDARDNSRRTLRISRKGSIGELYDRVCTLLKLEKSKVRIVDHYNGRKGAILSDLNQSAEDALIMDQEILLEIQRDGPVSPRNGKPSAENGLALVPFEPLRTSTSIAGGPTLSNGSSNGFRPGFLHSNGLYAASRDLDDGNTSLSNGAKIDGKGLTGLHNLGNTCFMNSSIQCLVHTPALVDYFLSEFSEEINEENPLGMHGELAVAFGDLLRNLWSSGKSPVAPRAFKAKLALFAPQFSGYNQHDSQELLAFLLDGLHEDLNRVRRKPFIEMKDSDGRPDEVYAEECWANHKARNDSIIVDICQGQYKSTLVCPVCSKVSVTFDPFMYLSLPLPSSVTRTMTITIIHSNGSALPMPFTVTVPKHGCCKDLAQALSTACCLRSDEALLLAEVYEHRIYNYFENPSESLSTIRDGDQIVAYTLPKDHERLLKVEIMHDDNTTCSSGRQSSTLSKLMGTPLVTCLPKGHHTATDLLAVVKTVLKPLMREIASLDTDKISNDEGSSPGVSDISLEGEDSCQPHQMDTEPEEDGLSPSKLSITDANASSTSPIPTDSTLYNVPCLRLLLEWSRTLHNIYDPGYMDDLPVCKSGFPLKKTRQEAISLFSCLEAFLKEEPLGPDDMWYCPRCKEHKQATKKLDLWRLPNILVIHLKRFSYSRYLKNKLDTFVNFPIHNFDLRRYLKHRPSGLSSVYELYAVSNHYGGLGGGHYTAYAKLINENSWYHFDDSHVSLVSEDSIRTSAAYVLFYRRVKAE